MLGSFSYDVHNRVHSSGNALGLAKYVCENHLTAEGKTVSHLSGSFCGVLNPLHLLVALPLGFYRIQISVGEAESCTGTELGSCQHVDDLITEAQAKSRGTEWITGQPMARDTEALCCSRGCCHRRT